MQTTTEAVQAAQKARAGAAREVTTLAHKLTSLTKKMNAAHTTVIQREEKLRFMLQGKDSDKEALAKALEQKEAQKQELKALEAEIAELNDTLATLDADADADEDGALSAADQAEFQALRRTARQQTAALHLRLRDMQRQQTAAQERHTATSGQFEALTSRAKDLEEQRQRLENKVERLQLAVQQVDKDHAGYAQQVKELEKQLAEIEGRQATLGEELQAVQSVRP